MIISAKNSVPPKQLDIVYSSSFSSSLVKNAGMSIIIPTFKRVYFCHKLLQSLEASKQQVNLPVEVIIVDNSPRQEAQKIADLCSFYQAKYYHKSISVGSKRNFGADVAKYPLLLFIDSDCEATPNLIQEHLIFYNQNSQTSAVLGATKFKGKKSLVWDALKFTPFLTPFSLADEYGEQIWGPSNNFSIRKIIFHQIGGFHEKFPQNPGGEDVDFGYRLYQQGYLFKTNPLAKVYHTTETWNTWGQNLKRFFNWGKGEFYLYINHHDYLCYDVPKSSLITIVLLIITAAIAILNLNLESLVLPLIFIVVNYVIRWILNIINRQQKVTNFFKIALAELFVIVYEWGLTWECFSQGWLVPLFHRLIIQKEQSLAIWNQQVIYTWITFLQITLTLGLWKLANNFSKFCQ